jgi:hypothetical protein
MHRANRFRHYLKYRHEIGVPERCDNSFCSYQTATFEWLGTPFVLELDHIDGAVRDNRVKNLRLLCPMCHRLQTDTHGGKNARRVEYTSGGKARTRPDGLKDYSLIVGTGHVIISSPLARRR